MQVIVQRAFLAAVAIGFLGTAGGATAGLAQDPVAGGQQAPSVAAPSQVRDDGRRTMGRFVSNLFRGTVGIFSTDNVKPLLIGGAATLGACCPPATGSCARPAVAPPAVPRKPMTTAARNARCTMTCMSGPSGRPPERHPSVVRPGGRCRPLPASPPLSVT